MGGLAGLFELQGIWLGGFGGVDVEPGICLVAQHTPLVNETARFTPKISRVAVHSPTISKGATFREC